MTIRMRNELLQRGAVDILQLAEIASIGKRYVADPSDESALMEVVARAIEDLLGQELAVIGDAVEEGGVVTVRPWQLAPHEASLRATGEWRRLGRLPILGEIAWLELTDLGHAQARSIG